VTADGLNESEISLVAVAALQAAARFSWYHFATAAPFLHESDLAATYYALADPIAPTDAVYLTSGTSSGRPKRVIWPAADHAKYVEQRGALIERFAAGECRTACADLGTGHAAGSALEVFERAGLVGSEIDFTVHVDRHVEILRETRPDLLFTMPMILERIVAAGGPGYVPRRIVVVGDLAPREWRRAMADRIGMDPRHILDVLGSIEVGAIAYSDDAQSAYLFHDHIIPEEGEDGLLALTSTARSGFPCVRYVSGDAVEGLRRYETATGTRWGYDHHLGRRGSEVKHGETLSLHAVAVAMAETAPGLYWQLRREGLEVVIELDERGYSADLAARVRSAVVTAHPDVEQMIVSGLVGDIAVLPMTSPSNGVKRSTSLVS